MKAQKVLLLKEREATRIEKEELLLEVKTTMDLYEDLMSRHNKNTVKKENPQEIFQHFE